MFSRSRNYSAVSLGQRTQPPPSTSHNKLPLLTPHPVVPQIRRMQSYSKTRLASQDFSASLQKKPLLLRKIRLQPQRPNKLQTCWTTLQTISLQLTSLHNRLQQFEEECRPVHRFLEAMPSHRPIAAKASTQGQTS